MVSRALSPRATMTPAPRGMSPLARSRGSSPRLKTPRSALSRTPRRVYLITFGAPPSAGRRVSAVFIPNAQYNATDLENNRLAPCTGTTIRIVRTPSGDYRLVFRRNDWWNSGCALASAQLCGFVQEGDLFDPKFAHAVSDTVARSRIERYAARVELPPGSRDNLPPVEGTRSEEWTADYLKALASGCILSRKSALSGGDRGRGGDRRSGSRETSPVAGLLRRVGSPPPVDTIVLAAPTSVTRTWR